MPHPDVTEHEVLDPFRDKAAAREQRRHSLERLFGHSLVGEAVGSLLGEAIAAGPSPERRRAQETFEERMRKGRME